MNRTAAVLASSLAFPGVIIWSMAYGLPTEAGLIPSAYPLLLVIGGTLLEFSGMEGLGLAFAISGVTIIVYLAANRDILAGLEPRMPVVSFVLLAIIVIAHLVYLAGSYEYAIRWQGHTYFWTVAVWNGLFAGACGLALLGAARTRKWGYLLAGRWCLFAWPLSVGFPWLGEPI